MNIFRKSIIKIISFVFTNFFYFSHRGFCPCCDKNVVFKSSNSWLRDNFFCPNCVSIPRERAVMLVIKKYFPNWEDLSIHESSPENRGASLKLQNNCSNYVATQYYPNQKFGSMVDRFRNEDLEEQTFDDGIFDIVITQDVMEHVYNPEKAFKEIARTLKKGGCHIFTVPIINKFNPTEVWATKKDNGEPLFIKTAEYHGNPVNPNGSPVTIHWGFDIVDFIKEKSSLNTKIEYLDDLDYGIRAEFIEVLISKKDNV